MPPTSLRYLEAFGYQRGADLPSHLALTVRSLRAARATMTERPPWEAEVDLDALVQARRPTLVLSGRWDNLAARDALGHRAFAAVCEAACRCRRPDRTRWRWQRRSPRPLRRTP